MFLDEDEIFRLTHRHRSDAQHRALLFMGIEHKIRMDGSIAVLRSHVEKVFGDGLVSKAARKTAPDFSAIT